MFQYILKPLKKLLIWNNIYSNAKKIELRQKKIGNKFLNWKILNFFNIVSNSYFCTYCWNWPQIEKFQPNQTINLFKSERTYSLTSLFLSKYFKTFQWLSKFKSLSFITKVYPNNKNETKSDTFPWGIFKSDIISCFIKKYWGIWMTLKIEISQFHD